VDIDLTPDQTDFQQEVREWLSANIPSSAPPESDLPRRREFDTAWQRHLYDSGYAGISWPAEWGGRGLGLVEQALWYEEVAHAGSPSAGVCGVALGHAGPTLLASGNEEQKRRHLPAILAGDEIWCQGFSEPGAGSDLASIRTRGKVTDSEIVISGQKIWTSYATVADYQELLVRTGSDSSGHKGLTWVIADMHSPGIEIRPITSIDGEATFCEVFYDGVAINRDNVVGEIDNGWRVAMTTLSIERGSAFMPEQIAIRRMLSDAVSSIAEHNEMQLRIDAQGDPTATVAEAAILSARVLALRAMTLKGVARSANEAPGPAGSMLRLEWGELMQDVATFAARNVGLEGLRHWDRPERRARQWSTTLLYSLSRTIASGTKDIQRNIIGERLLGLPRDRR
jgi:alkylation response protein AidB-like acyl-CoA dehydrogenase